MERVAELDFEGDIELVIDGVGVGDKHESVSLHPHPHQYGTGQAKVLPFIIMVNGGTYCIKNMGKFPQSALFSTFLLLVSYNEASELLITKFPMPCRSMTLESLR